MNTTTTNNPSAGDIAQVLGLKTSGRRKWVSRLVIGALVLAVAYWGFGVYREKRAAAAAIHYETSPVTRGGLTVVVSATGTLEPIKEVEVGSENLRHDEKR